MTPLPIDVNFDVSGTFPSGEQLTQSAWVFLPPSPMKAKGVLLCLAGGTYDKSYWHLVVPGFPRYSFAEHMAGMGFVVVALDHLGVGGSSDPKDSGVVGLELMARGDAAVAAQVAAMVEQGTLTDALPPLSDVPMVGVGHSMGACLTTMVQAEDRSFSAIALLGYSVDITNVHADQPTDADLNAAIDETE